MCALQDTSDVVMEGLVEQEGLGGAYWFPGSFQGTVAKKSFYCRD